MTEVVAGETDPQKAATLAALDEWARQWAEYRGTGEAHADAIRTWAAPTRPEEPAPPPEPDTDDTAARISYYLDRAARTIGRIKEHRGYSLYEKLPSGRGQWEGRHCGREGCPCSHGQFRTGHPGDWCDRGFIPTRDDPDGVREAARCPTCRQHAGTTKAAGAR